MPPKGGFVFDEAGRVDVGQGARLGAVFGKHEGAALNE